MEVNGVFKLGIVEDGARTADVDDFIPVSVVEVNWSRCEVLVLKEIVGEDPTIGAEAVVIFVMPLEEVFPPFVTLHVGRLAKMDDAFLKMACMYRA